MTDDEPTGERPDERAGLVDFSSVVTRLFWTAVVLGGLAVVGATVQGLRGGLTFAVLVQWGALFAVAFVLCAIVLLGVHALGGARRARSQGQRLGSGDIGLTPRGAARSLRNRDGFGPPRDPPHHQ